MPAVPAATDARRGRSFAARHGAALAAGVTALILLLVLTAFLPRRSLERAPPPPARWFDDRAGLVSPGFAAQRSMYLQQYLPLFMHASLLIVTAPKAPDGAIEDYTAWAASGWKIGAKGVDDGLVLFVFRDERTVRLEVGYGLEGWLPDIEAKRLVETTLLPQFALGQYEAGFDDFISGTQDKLKAYSAQTERADDTTGIFEYAVSVLRQTPRWLRQAWAAFLAQDLGGRVGMTLFGAVIASLLGYGLSGVLAGLWALVQLPWRLATDPAIRALGGTRLAAEFAPGEFVRRPPPSLVAVFNALGLGAIAWGAMCVAGMLIGIAFVGLGTDVLIGARGQFSGAGITMVWPAR